MVAQPCEYVKNPVAYFKRWLLCMEIIKNRDNQEIILNKKFFLLKK